MKHLRWIPLAALLVVPAFLVFSFARESMAVDSALDRGASYDYSKGQADFRADHPFIPFRDRHGRLLMLSGWSILGAVVYATLLTVASRRPDAS